MLKKRKQIIRLLEDVAIHLAIFLVLFGVATLSFIAANKFSTEAATVNFSVTIIDPNAPPPATEGGNGSPYQYQPQPPSQEEEGGLDEEPLPEEEAEIKTPTFGPWPFFDEALYGREPAFIERIVTPIKQIFRDIADELFYQTARAYNLDPDEKRAPRPILIDEASSRFEIHISLPRFFTPREAIIDESMVPREQVASVIKVIGSLMTRSDSYRVGDDIIVADIRQVEFRNITNLILSGQRVAITDEESDLLLEAQSLPAGSVVLRANSLTETIKPIVSLALDGHSTVLLKTAESRGQQTVQLIPASTQPIVIITPQDIALALDRGLITEQSLAALEESGSRKIIIPLSSYRYPNINLLLIITMIVLAIALDVNRRSEYKQYKDILRKKSNELKRKH